LERPCEDAVEKEGLALPISSHQPATFFSTVLAKHRSSGVEKLLTNAEQQLGVPGATAIREVGFNIFVFLIIVHSSSFTLRYSMIMFY
jgi:hypothetical protein